MKALIKRQLNKSCGLSLFILTVMAGTATLDATPAYFAETAHWYEAVRVPEGVVWEDANQGAISRGGYLCTITSSTENAFAASLVDISYYGNLSEANNRLGPWLGGYHNTDGVWRWVTGEPFVYTDWFSGQPDGYGGSDQRLIFFGGTAAGSTWADHPGTPVSGYPLPKGYIVEYDNYPLTVAQSSNVVTIVWGPTNTWALQTTSMLVGTNTVWTTIPVNKYQTNLPNVSFALTNAVGASYFRLKHN